MNAAKVGENSSLSRMIQVFTSADAGKAKFVLTADRWATWVVLIALTVSVLTYFCTGDILRSVTVLVVFCPYAMVLATPTAIMAGIGNFTKYGILVREGDALERLNNVKYLMFEKTGTLTRGTPEVCAVVLVHLDLSADALITLAASAEIRSEHQLGKSIIRKYKDVHGFVPEQPETFSMILVSGISATVCSRDVIYYWQL